MTEPQPDPDRPQSLWKRATANWSIPSRLFGRVRTSTVLLGVCFVLTALLYDHVRPAPELPQQGPVPVDTSVEQNQEPAQTYQQETSTRATTTPSVTGSAEPSGSESATESGSPSQDPGTVPTTTQRTILPGVPLPPQLESIFPTVPGSPSGTQ